jgi:hypothetical protein
VNSWPHVLRQADTWTGTGGRQRSPGLHVSGRAARGFYSHYANVHERGASPHGSRPTFTSKPPDQRSRRDLYSTLSTFHQYALCVNARRCNPLGSALERQRDMMICVIRTPPFRLSLLDLGGDELGAACEDVIGDGGQGVIAHLAQAGGQSRGPLACAADAARSVQQRQPPR